MSAAKEWKTPKGTTLYLRDLRGKSYLDVAERLIWFREERPGWSIKTSFLVFEPEYVTARAEIWDSQTLMASAHKTEVKGSFEKFAEKAETGAIGRALAFCGYGTQFCGEDLLASEDGVDSGNVRSVTATANSALVVANIPYTKAAKPAQTIVQTLENPPPKSENKISHSGTASYVLQMGKLKGEQLGNCGLSEVNAYYSWLTSTGAKSPTDGVRGSSKYKADKMGCELFLKNKMSSEKAESLDDEMPEMPSPPPWMDDEIPF